MALFTVEVENSFTIASPGYCYSFNNLSVNLQTSINWQSQVMAYSYGTYSVHCDKLITLSILFTNYASVIMPSIAIVLAVHQFLQKICSYS